MSRLFDPENRLWRWVDRIADVLVLSLLWTACSIPVITVGAASTALYDAAFHSLRGGERTPYSRFFRTLCREFKTATLSWLVWGGALAALLAGHFALIRFGGGSQAALTLAAACLALAVIPAGALCWAIPLLARFQYTFGGLCRTALQFWFAHLPSTLVMTALLALCVDWTLQLVFPLCFLPCLLALAHSWFAERAFGRHMPDQSGPPSDTGRTGEPRETGL